MKRRLLAVIMVTVTLLAIEGLARLAYWWAYDEGFSVAELRAKQARADGLPGQTTAAMGDGFRILHPYFGFTDNVADLPLNLIPSAGDAGEFQVAVVGGSVARQLSQPIEQRLRELARARGIATPIKVYACNAGGFKQPQQVMVLGWLLSMGARYDVVINIDGFNEVALSGVENRRLGIFPFYPRAWTTALPAGALAGEQALLGRLQAAAEERQALLSNDWAGRLSFTAFYGFWLRIQLDANTQEQRLLTQRIMAIPHVYSLERNGPAHSFPDDASLFAAIAEVWARGSRMLRVLAESAGAQYLHVLQPNQYLPGSKPLSDEERASFFHADYPYLPPVRDGYPLLRTAGRALLAEGIDFLDLTQLFVGTADTVYGDDCCHFNEAGLRRLSVAIVDQLLARPGSPLLRRLAQP